MFDSIVIKRYRKVKPKNPAIRIFDRVFLSIPLTIFLILSLGVISIMGVSPSFRTIFQSRLFLGYLCYIVLMMGYCSARRWPGLIKSYCYHKRIFPPAQDKGPSGSSFDPVEKKEVFNFSFKKENKPLATGHIRRVLIRQGYQKTAYCDQGQGEEKFFYEKAKLSIFGSHIVHLAIAVLLLAGIITAWGGRFYDFSIREGETIPLEGTEALLTLEKFAVIPSVTKERADGYASRLRINHPGKPIEWQTLKVNRPLRIDGVRLYQQRFNFNIDELRIAIFYENKDQPVKVLKMGINRRVVVPELNIALEVSDFFPDFYFDEKGHPSTRSHILRNPAGHLLIYSPANSSLPDQEQWIFRGVMPHSKSKDASERLEFMLGGIKSRYTSGIKYAKNPGEFITYLGLILLVGGSFLSSYQFYRGLVITVKEDIPGMTSHVDVRALKCKNIFGFEKEMNEMVKNFKQRMEGL